jgi:hypothetical protein
MHIYMVLETGLVLAGLVVLVALCHKAWQWGWCDGVDSAARAVVADAPNPFWWEEALRLAAARKLAEGNAKVQTQDSPAQLPCLETKVSDRPA